MKYKHKKPEEYRYTTSNGHVGVVKNNMLLERKDGLLWYLLAQVYAQINKEKTV